MKVSMTQARELLERKDVKLVETVRTHGGLRFNIVCTLNKAGNLDARGNQRRPKVLRVDPEGLTQ